MAGDRISEAYEGKLSEAMHTNSRKRIDWFCDNVTGQNILDIGCSQGILPILLGKKGCSVVGIDNDKDSIAYALNALKSEDISVQERVEFICGDFLEHDFGDSKFDTIVMGEVMEHLFNPLLFLKKATELLKDDGLFVVSVPFGINRHPDHKRTYYFYDFYNQVNAYFCVEKVIFMGKWIAIKAVSKENSLKMPIQLDTMYPRLENAIYTLEEILEKERNDLKSKLAQSDEFTKKLKEEKADLLVSVNDYKNQLQEAEKKQERIVADFERKQEEIVADFERKYQEDERNYKRKLNESTAKYKRLEKKYAYLRNSKLGSIQVQYWSFRNRCRKRLAGPVLKIKGIAKKSPFLCSLVQNYRNKKMQGTDVAVQQLKCNQNEKKPKLNVAQRRALFEAKTDKDFFDSIKDILGNIPESNGGRYYKKHKIKIGIIADKFLYAAFRDAAEFVYITPENWEEVVLQTDFLLMVSAWRGLYEEWRGIAKESSQERELVYKIIEKYKEQGKITVFYSKEDPPNYHVFIGIAKKCDYIFTTCAEVVENYKRDCGNDNVNVLCFSINPLYHNPVGIKNPYKKDGVIFSGSWMKKYPERLIDMHMLFDGVLDAGQKLKIIDRNYSNKTTENYRYPEEYWPYVSPEIDHTLLQKVHKLYNWAININTVTDSMTMFANRVYELQATGNLLISNYSVGVSSHLPTVYIVFDKSEIGPILNGYTEEEVYEHQIAAVRSVMTGETAFDRIGQLIETLGFQKEANERKILVVADVLSDSIKEMFENQTYPFKKLISLDDFTQKELEESDMTAFFKDGMEYGMFYLEDMSNGFKYTDSSYITKDSYYHGKEIVSGKEHDYVSVMKNKYATLFWNEDFSIEQLKSLTDEMELQNGYSIDHFNYNLER